MIEKLTKKQENAIVPFREKWIERILRTEQTDEEIKNNVKGIYTLAGLPQPKEVWIMDSMFGVQVAINVLKQNKKDIKDVYKNIESNIWSNIRSNIRSNIWSNIESNIWSNIRSNIRSNIWSNIWSNIRSNIRSNIGSNIRSNIESNIGSNIESNIWSNIRSNIESNIGSNIESNIGSNIGSNIESIKLEFFGFSSNEASWLHWYVYQKYYYDNGLLLPDKYSELLNSYIEMAIDAWAVYYSDDIAIVSRKPEVKRNGNGFLHSTNSPAVSFKDGYELYYLNGVNFPKELFDKVTSGEMPFEEILAIEDIDQRTQAMRFGDVNKFIEVTKGELLDEHTKHSLYGKDVNYKLYKIPKGDIFTVDAYYVVYDCPSTDKQYMSGVIECKTVPEAMAWKSQVSVEDWTNMIPLKHES